MSDAELLAVAWNNGSFHKSGAGYGVKLNVADRDSHLKRHWGSIILYLGGQGQPVTVNIDSVQHYKGLSRQRLI